MQRSIKVLPIILQLTGADWGKIGSGAEILNQASPTTKITFTRLSDPGIEPKVFEYKINSLDGRVWKQVLTFDSQTDPVMTFVVNDPWRMSEFSQQRQLRDAFVAFVGAYPTLEKITYDFT